VLEQEEKSAFVNAQNFKNIADLDFPFYIPFKELFNLPVWEFLM